MQWLPLSGKVVHKANGKLNIHVISNTTHAAATLHCHGQTPLTSVIERDVYAHANYPEQA